VDGSGWLAERFEENRTHLRSVAYRMLGSPSEAEDAVQEAWLKVSRANAGGVENLGGWLTTVVARVCLDMLRSRKSRREDPLDARAPEPAAGDRAGIDPERDALQAESVGLAMLVVLERLAPAERVAFVLHDMFDLPFDEIAPILGRSPEAARQLASRARRRVRSGDPVPDTAFTRRREVIEAYIAAARGGDFEALLAVLDPDIVMRADSAAVQMGAPQEVRGPAAVFDFFKTRSQGAKLALVDGVPGAAWAQGGRPRVVFGFTIAGGKIVAIDLIADPARLGELDVEILETT